MNLFGKKSWWRWLLVLLWMGVIFYMSHEAGPQSHERSAGIVEAVEHVVEVITGTVPAPSPLNWGWNYWVRKLAHMTEYFILAMLVWFALSANIAQIKQLFTYTYLLCVLYATSDEWHQFLTGARDGRWQDVGIDSIGIGVGIAVSYGIARLKKRRSKP